MIEPAEAGTEAVGLAQEASALGQAAIAAHDPVRALAWYERAHRLLPHDPNITLSLATRLLAHDAPRAALLYERVAARYDIREAWYGLAAARRRTGDRAGAAFALGAALARAVPQSGLDDLAMTIARDAGAPGWCGLTGVGEVMIGPRDRAGAVAMALDDVPVAGSRLPDHWPRSRSLTITHHGLPLLGSPIDIAAIRRVAGCVEARNDGLEGWAWHPGDPDLDPELEITGPDGTRLALMRPSDGSAVIRGVGPLARPRRFTVPADLFRTVDGLVHVRDRDGRDLLGSPLQPNAERRGKTAAALAIAARYRTGSAAGSFVSAGAPAPGCLPLPVEAERSMPVFGADPQRREVDVVIPVYNQSAVVLACLARVLATVHAPDRIVVIDDASTEPALLEALRQLADQGRLVLRRNDRNLGFPASVNAGLRAGPGRDAVLLNSDTLVPDSWLQRLRDAAYGSPDIGTVTPLSNDASILNYPGPSASHPAPDLADTLRLDRLAQGANGTAVVDIPVGVGFCLFIRRDCLDAVGLPRADVFAQGYGEENDFCLRARHLGWRSVALPGLFVAHVGGHSFGAAGHFLRVRNETILNRLHPGYDTLVRDFIRHDPLAPSRRRLDLARWRTARGRNGTAAILVTHNEGGGVEQRIIAACETHRRGGRRPVVLRPATLADGSGAVSVSDGVENSYPNLRFAMPGELPALLRLLRAERPEIMEVHHLLRHHPDIRTLPRRLGMDYQVHVHDYEAFCPRVSLVGLSRRYCGEPTAAGCEACVADAGRIAPEVIGIDALRDRASAFLAGASRVIAPSDDTAVRMRRHFPTLRVTVLPHADDRAIAEPRPPQLYDGLCVVCVVGGIGIHKGYDVLLDCARDAATRNLRLKFVLVGSSIDDRRLLATGRVFVTGPYEPAEAVGLIRAQNASLGWISSIWPETWCLTLGELWRAGLRTVSFDIGAQSERIRRAGRGWVLPLGLSASALNARFLALAGSGGPA